MSRKGYWIECMPLWEQANENAAPDLYRASVTAIPDMVENAPSASKAIQKLRDRLKELKAQYSEEHGVILPRLENPVRPPKRPDSVRGWMSVYIEMNE
ncbi:MAG: hypothetical protein VX740_02085 [Pseudomonadota bacterium]|nr:hypothetical protein [Alphaproteobacteria bacterium]MEC7576741.1 hypothetical protein [Pseudomonadota bacterium]MEC7701447.1 hypothetical protein [Pseudomonadota bacterium]MED5422207.1 hypothetical protein [Pseudomonadota bacterium]MEE3322996.1 hypothetical protein [Pseudomonadota bacterium]